MSEFAETSRKNNGPYIAIILLLLLGLAVMGFMWSRKNSLLNECTVENAQLNADMEGMNEMMQGYVGNLSNDLKTDFKNMLKTYDALIAKDKSKADSLNVQKAKIQDLIDQLDQNKKMTASQLYKMRKENETLRTIMKGYVRQIDSLNTMNLKLTSVLDETTSKLNSTTQERDDYKQQAETSADQVKKGSRLQAYNFSSGGFRMKLNNLPEPASRAKQVVQIKSSFTLSENPITVAGKKTVYMQVINPDGKVLQTRTSNTVSTENGVVAYSDKKEIDYQNQRLDIAIYYDLRGEELVKGNYKVKIYCDGNLVGSDSFTLK
jgi:hypothetical protein